jgi:hypothetical protein
LRFLVRRFLALNYVQADMDTDDGQTISFEPNPTLNLGATLGYKKLKGSFSYGVERANDVAQYGNSTSLNVELSLAFRPGGYELVTTTFLDYHRGLSTAAVAGGRHVMPDAVLLTAGLDASIFFNKDFSWEKSLDEFARRKGSHGSWVVRASAGLVGLGFTSAQSASVIPADRAASAGRLTNARYVRDGFFSLSGGYAYDWNIVGRLFLTGIGTVGATASLVDIQFAGGGNRSAPAIGPSVSLNAGLTYVGDTFHGGLTTSAVLDAAQAGTVMFSPVRVGTLLFFGARF